MDLSRERIDANVTENTAHRVEHPDLEAVTSQLAARKEVTALYLFGSRAAGTAGPMSDTDLAVLLSEDVPAQDYFNVRLELLAEVSAALGMDRVDLVVLNDAPLALRYRIISTGKILFCKDEPRRIRFTARAITLYLDFLPVEEEMRRGLARRIREGKFGA